MWKVNGSTRITTRKFHTLKSVFASQNAAAKPVEDENYFSNATQPLVPEVKQQPKVEKDVIVDSKTVDVIQDEPKSNLPDKRISTFDDMPGPSSLKYMAKLWSYVPILSNHLTTSSLQYFLSAGKIFGTQLSWGNNLSIFKYLLNEYGPLVRLRGPFGGDVVILSRPEHAHIVFQNEGPHPIRSSLDCVEKYRLQHRQYRHAGPFIMSGPQWEVLRKNVEPAIYKSLNSHYGKISEVCDDFVTRASIIRNRQLEVPNNFRNELCKWSLESLCMLMFNRKLGFLDPKGLSPTAETSVLLDALNDATDAIKKCEFGLHLWKIFETRSWKKLVQNCDTIDHILGSYVKKTQDVLRERRDNPLTVKQEDMENCSLMETFLIQDSLNSEDILTVLLDMLLIGVNTTTHTAGFLMYHLARNPRHQHRVYQEVKELPETFEKIDCEKMIYMRACLYESLRLNPPMPVLSRILENDVDIHGYHIPKGTFMLIATNLSSLREEHFEDATKFKPQRWLGGVDYHRDVESLATIPFGVGPRACLARELALAQISFLIAKILRKFRIEYHYGDIESNNNLLAAPKRPFKFRLVERD